MAAFLIPVIGSPRPRHRVDDLPLSNLLELGIGDVITCDTLSTPLADLPQSSP